MPATNSESVMLDSKSLKTDRPDERPGMLYIPDVLANWKWPLLTNQYQGEVMKETREWAIKSGAFKPSALEAFDRCIFSLLGCMVYPHHDHEALRLGCDALHVLWAIDESTDVENAQGVRKQKSIIMDALRNPHKRRPENEWAIGELAREWWERTILRASPGLQKRLVEDFDMYLEAVIQEAADRDVSCIRDIESFVLMRRYAGAAFVTSRIIELCMNVPDEVMKHQVIQELEATAADLIYIANDLVSYNLEQARGGDAHNIVRVAMDELELNPQAAVNWAADYHEQLERKFAASLDKIPKWGEPIDSQVAQYCNGLGIWVRGNYEWSFKTERYFGPEGEDVYKTRWVKMMPKNCKQGIASRWM